MSNEQLVLIGDDAVTSIELSETGEPLVDVSGSQLLVDNRLADRQGFYRRLRGGVVSRLEQAQDLLPTGWRLAVVEGYRPISTQRRYFQLYLDEVRTGNPALTPEQHHRLATRHIAPVLESADPPHSTGGAVDLTMIDADGVEITVGCAVNATPEESDGACYTNAPGLSRLARTNRDLLVSALAQVGLVNYSPEWWHWSYGDQYWALQTGAASTRYSRLSEQEALR